MGCSRCSNSGPGRTPRYTRRPSASTAYSDVALTSPWASADHFDRSTVSLITIGVHQRDAGRHRDLSVAIPKRRNLTASRFPVDERESA